MAKYIAVYNDGFETLIETVLKASVPDSVVEHNSESHLYFSTDLAIDKVAELPFFKKIFLVNGFFDKDFKLESMLRWAKFNTEFRKSIEDFAANSDQKSFRVVSSKYKINQKDYVRDLQNIESLLKAKRIKIDSASADYEIVFSEKNTFGFIGINITNNNLAGLIGKNALDTDVAFIMNYLSEPNEQDIYLDPFCGNGTLPIIRSQFWKYKTIYATDINAEMIKEKVKRTNLTLKNFEIMQSDIASLKDIKVNKIVTDPPWGAWIKVESINELYKEMFVKFAEVLGQGGIIILLTSQAEVMNNLLQEYQDQFKLVESYPVKVAGKNASIFKFKIRN